MVYSLWRRGDQTYSLVQFAASDLGLADSTDRRTLCCEQPGTDVMIWSEGGRGYALASDHGALEGVLTMNTRQTGRRVGGCDTCDVAGLF